MKHAVLFVVCAFALLVLATAVNAELIFADNWNDQTVFDPSFAAPGVDWVVESGAFSATTPFPGFAGPMVKSLMFGTTDNSRISVIFGETVVGAPVEARFKIHQGNGAYGGNYRFSFGFKDTDSGLFYQENGALNPSYYGGAPNASGFNSYNNAGQTLAGAPGQSFTNGWSFMKMIFDPATGVQVWQSANVSLETLQFDDPSLTYTLVASWTNFKNISSVNQFYLESGNTVSWKIDDVEILGTPVPEPTTMLALASALIGVVGTARRKRR